MISVNFFILRLFNDLSPLILTSISVVESIPIKSLAKVPEFPKLRLRFFFAYNEPSPFPNIEYDLFPFFFIYTKTFKTTNCGKHLQILIHF